MLTLHRLMTLPMLVTMLTPASGASAAEKKIARAELPAAVERTVSKESHDATINGFSTEQENGKTVYEMELTVNGHRKDILMNAQGDVLEVEEEVVLTSLPAAVQTGLAHIAGTGKIVKVEALTKQNQLVAYEAIVQSGKTRREVQVGADGQRLATPK